MNKPYIIDGYDKAQIMIEKGIDELFYDLFDNIYFSLTEEQLNYLMILASEKNELDMVKHIYKKSSELDCTETKYLFFSSKYNLIKETTKEICLLRSVTNGNNELYEWLKSIGTKIPVGKEKLYFKNACKSGNYNIIMDIYFQDKHLYENYINSGIKIVLENGHIDTFNYMSRLECIEFGDWIFNLYFRSPINSIKVFSSLYQDYNKYYNNGIFLQGLCFNRLEESKLLYSCNKINEITLNRIIHRYIEQVKNKDVQMILWLMSITSNKEIHILCILSVITIYKNKKVALGILKDFIKSHSNIYNEIYNILFDDYYYCLETGIETSDIIGGMELLFDLGFTPPKNHIFHKNYQELNNQNVYIK